MLAPVLCLFSVFPLPQDFSDAPIKSGRDFPALDAGLGPETPFTGGMLARGHKPRLETCLHSWLDFFAFLPLPGEKFPF